MIIKKEHLWTFLGGIFLFFLIFNPPLIKGVSFTTVITILLFLYILVNNGYYFLLRRESQVFSTTVNLVILFVLYVIIIGLFNALVNSSYADVIFNNIASDIFYTIAAFSNAIAISIFLYKKNVNVKTLLNGYIIAGFIQCVLAIASFIMPSIKTTFVNIIMANSGSDKISRSLQYTSEYRNYGFASSLYDIFSFAMCCLAAIALSKVLQDEEERKGRNLILFFLLAFSAVINARTTIILIAVVIVYVIFSEGLSGNIGKMLAVVLTAGVMLLLLLKLASNSEWLSSGFQEIVSFFFDNETTGYFNTLFNDFLFFPNNIFEILLGTTMTPMQYINTNSDVGYIQNLWKYGVVGSILLYSPYILLIRSNYKIRKMKKLAAMFGIMLAIYLIKLNPMGYSMFSQIALPIFVYGCLVEAQK